MSARKLDLHTHYYPPIYFEKIRDLPSEFSFDKSPSGQTIIKYRGARFFGVTPPMTDVARRLADMDRVGIDVEVISLSTPNLFFADAQHQPEIARIVNDAYAELIAQHPARFKGFASIPMDTPDAALNELHRAIDELKLNGVILLSNIAGKPLTSPEYRPFFAEANRMKLCILLHPMLPANAEPFREYVLGPIVGFMFDTTLAVARMCFDGMLREFPDIRWIVGHLGGAVPYLMERMDNGWRDFPECRTKIDELPSSYLKRLYYDTVNFNPHMLMMVREMIGADRMVLGSDYPHLLGSIERAVSSIESLDISNDEKLRIFEGTALSILNNV
ncbi:MAG TPA: amidohydrolase family protein [Pyrinomonadaceae bacterium]|jgi:aminocarboxymuconate-semialdehyde decarboxylase|nr:amidohydrolase family protein [Pyrinomonadaceae bacterium]